MLAAMNGNWLPRFACAFRGMAESLRREPSLKVHAIAAIAVMAAGAWFKVSAVEWAVLALACGGVIAAELLNTAIERLADRVSAEREEAIRIVKDAAAGGVLAAALGAVGAGLAIFGPRLWALVASSG